MKPAAFDYVRAATTNDVLDVLAQQSDARLLAGGQSLVPLMNLRLARPAILVDINGVAALDHITEDRDGGLLIGALARHRRIETSAVVAARAPLLAEAASLVGHVAIRNRGTLGGAIAHADPASELPAALMALGARVVATSRRGERRATAEEHFAGWFSTTLAADEVVTAIEVPPPVASAGGAFVEIAPRPGDYAIAGVAAVVTCDEAGRFVTARLAGCGVGDRPVDLTAAAEPMLGLSADDPRWPHETARLAATLVDPVGDVRASVDDRRELVQVLVVRAARVAARRARPPASDGEEVR